MNEKIRIAMVMSMLLASQPEPPVPAPSTPVVKSCPCSSRCVCGCNEGHPCQCGNARVITSVPFTIPAFQRTSAPAAVCAGGG